MEEYSGTSSPTDRYGHTGDTSVENGKPQKFELVRTTVITNQNNNNELSW